MGGRRRRSGGRVEGAPARGIALVVLWTLLLLSLIAAGFLAIARTRGVPRAGTRLTTPASRRWPTPLAASRPGSGFSD